nr:hypothetical protein [Tanacetum cinerariifolium]
HIKGHSLNEEGLGLEGSKEEAVPEGQQQGRPRCGDSCGLDEEGLGLEGSEEEAVPEAEEDRVHRTFEIGHGSGAVPEPKRPERVSALRQPTVTTWIEPKNGRTYIDIPTYPPQHHSFRHHHLLSGRLRLDAMPPTLFEKISKDVSELYTRSGVVRDEIFSERYRLRYLEYEQERTAVTFGALWRPMLALKACEGHVDTRMTGLSWAGYDDNRQERDRRER